MTACAGTLVPFLVVMTTSLSSGELMRPRMSEISLSTPLQVLPMVMCDDGVNPIGS